MSGQPIGRRRKFWEFLKLPIQKKPSSILEEAFLYIIDPFSCKKDCGKKAFHKIQYLPVRIVKNPTF